MIWFNSFLRLTGEMILFLQITGISSCSNKNNQSYHKESKLEGTMVSMCGEMAGDTFAIPLLVGMGLDSVSVVPSASRILNRLSEVWIMKKQKNLPKIVLRYSKMEDIY